MKEKYYQYNLYVMNRKEPLVLLREEGQKLSIALMQQNIPKFVLIDDNVIAISSISRLEKVENFPAFPNGIYTEEAMKHFKEYGHYFDMVELTLSEIETQEKYQQLKKGFTGQSQENKQIQ